MLQIKIKVQTKKFKIETLRNVIPYIHINKPTSMWLGFMLIHGQLMKYSWLGKNINKQIQILS